MKFTELLILAVFYTVYIGKMLLQKRKGIRTDQIANCQFKISPPQATRPSSS